MYVYCILILILYILFLLIFYFFYCILALLSDAQQFFVLVFQGLAQTVCAF